MLLFWCNSGIYLCKMSTFRHFLPNGCEIEEKSAASFAIRKRNYRINQQQGGMFRSVII